MDTLFFYWLIKALLFLILEIGNPGLFLFLSFSIGALVGAATNFFEYTIPVQLAAAFSASIIMFVVLSVWIRHRFKDKRISHVSNVDALIGRKGIVLEHIAADAVGAIKVNGAVWSARSHNDHAIPVGSPVVIVGIKGVTLHVAPHDEQF